MSAEHPAQRRKPDSPRALRLQALPRGVRSFFHAHLVQHTPALLDDVACYPLQVTLDTYGVSYVVNGADDVHAMIAEARDALDGPRTTEPCPGGAYRSELPPKPRCAGCENEHSGHAPSCYLRGKPAPPEHSPQELADAKRSLKRAAQSPWIRALHNVWEPYVALAAWCKSGILGVLAPIGPSRRS